MDKSTAAHAIRKLAIQYQAMVMAADVLETLGAIENAERETRGRVEAARASETEALAALAAVKDAIDLEEQKAKNVIADSGRRADELRSEAEETARKTMAEAEDRAMMLQQNAVASTDAKQNESRQRLSEIERLHVAKVEALAQVSSDLASKSVELAEMNAKICQAKDALRQFVGA